MKMTALMVLLTSTLHLSSVAAGEPSDREVSDGIRRAVVFEVAPGPSGRAESCRLIEVLQLPSGEADPEFTPTAEYQLGACNEALGKRSNWIPESDSNGAVLPKRETCLWSVAIPDSPICRAELGLDFADEIPKGIGKTVVFELMADSRGALVSCSFSATYSLSDPKVLPDVPHKLFVDDGCRKFNSVLWINADRPPNQAFFMPCRFIDEIPARAFCERKFAE